MAEENKTQPARRTRRDPYRLTGETFGGRYHLEEFAGMGSFGAVYRATDRRVGRTVAVKILKPDLGDDETTVARELFQREALTAGRLMHPHIVAVTDVGEESDFAYLVMEWLDGYTLEDELRTRIPFSPEETASLLAPIADALQTAHDAGVIHRDLKPANIYVGRRDRPFVKVLDFGIAKVVTSATAATASRIAGTASYMSPEQITGSRIDRRTDIYSLGIVLYQMLAGELPFKGESQGHIIQQHIAAPPPSLAEARPDIPPALSQVIERALGKLPEARQQSAQELYTEFTAALSLGINQQKREASIHEQQTILLSSSMSPTVVSPSPVEQSPALTKEAAVIPKTVAASPEQVKRQKVSETSFAEPAEAARPTIQPRDAYSPGKILVHSLVGAVIFLIIGSWWWSANQNAIEHLELAGGITNSEIYSPELWQDAIFGASFGILICALRRRLLWSIEKGHRVRAFVIHSVSGAAVAMILFFIFYFLPAASENTPRSWGFYFFHRYHLSSLVYAFWGAVSGIGIFLVRILFQANRR